MDYLKNLFDILHSCEYTDVKGDTIDFETMLKTMLAEFAERRKAGKIINIGNGGSAAIASHATTDLTKNAKIPALCFSDYSTITCLSNDYGYNNAYKEALILLAGTDDLLVAVSSSGKSENILNAVQKSRELGNYIITFSGFGKDNPLRKLGDINIYCPSSHYGMVELCHQIILHMVTDILSEDEKS